RRHARPQHLQQDRGQQSHRGGRVRPRPGTDRLVNLTDLPLLSSRSAVAALITFDEAYPHTAVTSARQESSTFGKAAWPHSGTMSLSNGGATTPWRRSREGAPRWSTTGQTSSSST